MQVFNFFMLCVVTVEMQSMEIVSTEINGGAAVAQQIFEQKSNISCFFIENIFCFFIIHLLCEGNVVGHKTYVSNQNRLLWRPLTHLLYFYLYFNIKAFYCDTTSTHSFKIMKIGEQEEIIMKKEKEQEMLQQNEI